jgi:hypothetical protein
MAARTEGADAAPSHQTASVQPVGSLGTAPGTAPPTPDAPAGTAAARREATQRGGAEPPNGASAGTAHTSVVKRAPPPPPLAFVGVGEAPTAAGKKTLTVDALQDVISEAGLADAYPTLATQLLEEGFDTLEDIVNMTEETLRGSPFGLKLGHAQRFKRTVPERLQPPQLTPAEAMFARLAFGPDPQETDGVDFKSVYDIVKDSREFLRDVAALHNAVGNWRRYTTINDAGRPAAFIVIGVHNQPGHPNMLWAVSSPQVDPTLVLQQLSTLHPTPTVTPYQIRAHGRDAEGRVHELACTLYEIEVRLDQPVVESTSGLTYVRRGTATFKGVRTPTAALPAAGTPLPDDIEELLREKFSDRPDFDLDAALAPLATVENLRTSFKILILNGSPHPRTADAPAAQALDLLAPVDWDLVIDLDSESMEQGGAWHALDQRRSLFRAPHELRVENNRPHPLPLPDKGARPLLWLFAKQTPLRTRVKDFRTGAIDKLLGLLLPDLACAVVVVALTCSASESDAVRKAAQAAKNAITESYDSASRPLVLVLAQLGANMHQSVTLEGAQSERFHTVPLYAFASGIVRDLGSSAKPADHFKVVGCSIPAVNFVEYASAALEIVYDGIGAPDDTHTVSAIDAARTDLGASKTDDGSFCVEFGSHVGTFSTDELLWLNFLRGAALPWRVLSACEHPHASTYLFRRLALDQLLAKVRKRLARPINNWFGVFPSVLFLRHDPSVGATTLAMQLAWQLKNEYPCIFLPESAQENHVHVRRQLYKLQRQFFPDKPLLVIVEWAPLSAINLSQALSQSKNETVKAVVMAVTHHTPPTSTNPDNIVQLHELSGNEQQTFIDTVVTRLSRFLPNSAHLLEQMHDVRSPLMLGLIFFGRLFDQQRLERHVKACLANVDNAQDRRILAVASLLHACMPKPRELGTPLVAKLRGTTEAGLSLRRLSALTASMRNLLVVSAVSNTNQLRLRLPSKLMADCLLVAMVGPALASFDAASRQVTAYALAAQCLLETLFDVDVAAYVADPASERVADLFHPHVFLSADVQGRVFRDLDERVRGGLIPVQDAHDPLTLDILRGLFAGQADLHNNYDKERKLSPFIHMLNQQNFVGDKVLFALAALSSRDPHVLAHYGRFLTMKEKSVNEDVQELLRGYQFAKAAFDATNEARLAHLAASVGQRVLKRMLYGRLEVPADEVYALAPEMDALLERGANLLATGDVQTAALCKLKSLELRVVLRKLGLRMCREQGVSFEKMVKTLGGPVYLSNKELADQCIALVSSLDHFVFVVAGEDWVRRCKESRLKFLVEMLKLTLQHDVLRGPVADQTVMQYCSELLATQQNELTKSLAGDILIGKYGPSSSKWRPFERVPDSDLLAFWGMILNSKLRHRLRLLRMAECAIECGIRGLLVADDRSDQQALVVLSALHDWVSVAENRTDAELWTYVCVVGLALWHSNRSEQAFPKIFEATRQLSDLCSTQPALANRARQEIFYTCAAATGLASLRDYTFPGDVADDKRTDRAMFWNLYARDVLWRVEGTLEFDGARASATVKVGNRSYVFRVPNSSRALNRSVSTAYFFPVVCTEGIVLNVDRNAAADTAP